MRYAGKMNEKVGVDCEGIGYGREKKKETGMEDIEWETRKTRR